MRDIVIVLVRVTDILFVLVGVTVFVGVIEELDVLELVILFVRVTDEVPVMVCDLVGVNVFDADLDGVILTVAVFEEVLVRLPEGV